MSSPSITRRRFFKTTALGAGSLALLNSGAASAALSDAAVVEARHRARARKRRIIMNNDGNDCGSFAKDEPVTVENFLNHRSSPLLGSQVDSIFYCTGVFNLYTHRTKECETHFGNAAHATYLPKIQALGTTPLDMILDFGKKNNIEIFWSMRMNDTHDSGTPGLLCKWKQDHPEYLVGEKGKKLPYGCNRWSSVDYGVPEVREKVFRILEEMATTYDVDGIEMDFFRHPVLFKEQMTGEPVSQAHCDLMTGLIRRVRSVTEAVAKKRRRPFLLSIRIPDSVDYCKALGIDLVRWLEEDLIDLIAGAGYFKLEPWENMVALGKKYQVPVYACLVSRRLMGGGKPEAGTAAKIWRGEALNAWKAGMDGIYTFNRFNPKDPIFREIGDPKLLESLEHTDQTSYVARIWSRPETWVKHGKKYIKEPK